LFGGRLELFKRGEKESFRSYRRDFNIVRSNRPKLQRCVQEFVGGSQDGQVGIRLGEVSLQRSEVFRLKEVRDGFRGGNGRSEEVLDSCYGGGLEDPKIPGFEYTSLTERFAPSMGQSSPFEALRHTSSLLLDRLPSSILPGPISLLLDLPTNFRFNDLQGLFVEVLESWLGKVQQLSNAPFVSF
jgi:hypothetical protein